MRKANRYTRKQYQAMPYYKYYRHPTRGYGFNIDASSEYYRGRPRKLRDDSTIRETARKIKGYRLKTKR